MFFVFPNINGSDLKFAIFNKQAWSDQLDLFEKQIYGTKKENYLLFEGVTASMFYSDIMKAVEVTKLRLRSPHKTRHTFLTWFYWETLEDTFIAERVGGHSDKRSLEVYSHMREQLGRELQFKKSNLQRMNCV